MKSVRLVSESPAATFRIGRTLGELLKEGDIVALTGELGAGKTCLTQGIARGLGVPDSYRITSPTFTLANEYPGRLKLVHLDVYRLSGSQDLPDLGYEEFFFGGGVTVIEWAEKIGDAIPEHSIRVAMAYLDPDRRSVEIAGLRDRIAAIEKALKEGGL